MKHVAILAALLLPPAALASDLDALVAKVVDTYGGAAAWARVQSIDEKGRVEPSMRKGPGALTRRWSGAGDLRVEIVYPDKTEVRALERGKGANNGRESSAMELDGMRLQAARLALPRLLAGKKSSLRDLGMKDNVRIIEIALDVPLIITVDIDPATAHIVRSVGHAKEASFTTVYSDLRTVSGLLIAFHEENSAMGIEDGGHLPGEGRGQVVRTLIRPSGTFSRSRGRRALAHVPAQNATVSRSLA